MRVRTERRADGRSLTYYVEAPEPRAPSVSPPAPDSAILVTGGCGYVATPLVHRLVRAGRCVVVLDDLSTSSGRTLPPGVPLVRARVGDAVVLEEVFARWRIEAVFHFAAASRVGESVADPLAYYRCNMVEGLTLLECVVRHGRVPFVFSSSASVYGVQERVPIPEDAPLRPVSPYAETKRAFEAALEWAGRAYGLPWVALRYFNAAGAEGPWEPKAEETHLIPLALQAARGGPPLTVYGTDYPTRDGTAERDYVHVGDLAEGHLAALAHLEAGGASGPFNLGSGRGHTVAEVLAVVEAVTGRPVPRVLAARRPGDPASSVADPARARAVLGWEARRSDLRRIVQDAWEAMRRVREEGRA